MTIDRAGVPFVAAALVPAAALVALARPRWGLPMAALAGLFAFFFRDPDREPPVEHDAVVSPADGRVVHAGPAEASGAPAGVWQQISIFLSPLDVHVNRIPVGGTVTSVQYRPGRFLPAYRAEAAVENERCEIAIDHDGQTVVCRQVVGILARRVVCRVQPGAHVDLGERFGIMKFGSRMDVYLPVSARLETAVDEVVRGGETILARLAPEPPAGAAVPENDK